MVLRRIRRLATIVLLLASSCRFLNLEIDKRRLEAHAKVLGKVHFAPPRAGPIYVAAFSAEGTCRTEKYCLAASQAVPDSNNYELLLRKGDYFLFAFEDKNRNQDIDAGERSVMQEVEVQLDEQDILHRNLRIEDTVPEKLVKETRTGLWRDDRLVVVGQKADLDHPRFGQKEAKAAVWRPTRALRRYPAGLFVLDDVDADKVPVIFVHGMGGYAQEFRPMIAELPTRFSPWVYQYPGGLPLSHTAVALRSAIVEMADRFDLDTVGIVAHSMGGLVVRRALQKTELSGVAVCLVTIATPFGGVPSATRGVEKFPFVIPSWRDIDPNSPFIEQLYRDTVRPNTQHLLIDLRINGKDDGVIPIKSQRRDEALAEASAQRSFQYQHTEALAEDDVIDDVNAFLRRCAERPVEPLERNALGDAQDPQ